jgi:hypothetical protein
MQIIFQYPAWFILFCVLLGLVYASVLYYKSDHFSDDTKNFTWTKRGLALLRFLSGTLLAFLLLSPFIKSKFIDKIEPVIVFVHDNSESILLNLNSEDSAKYIKSTNDMLTNLSEKYQVDYYAFDDKINEIDTLNFKGKSTNISFALDQINGLYFNQNVGAVIFATDGIYNQGNNPIYSDFNFPIYTVALGDTNQQTDVKIVNARANKLAYLDDKVLVEVELQANHLQGKQYQLSLSGKNALIFNKTIPITKDFDEQKTTFTLDAKSIGIHRYIIEVQEFENEISLANNRFEFYIEVIDNRQKILLLANAPHPDIAAIKSVISVNKNFEIEIQYVQKMQANLDDYSLLIMHQVPSETQGAKNILSNVKSSKIPTWYIAGSSTDYASLNQEQNIVQISTQGKNGNDASAYFNARFNTFNLSENTIAILKKFPPLLTPFGNYNLSPGSTVLFYQKIGTVQTEYPILAFQENLGIRSALFVGDGLWRWKVYDFLENNSNEVFNEIIEKTINYLALKGDKRKFRVKTNKSAYFDGELVKFEAELYNDNYELINGPEVSLLVTNEDGSEYPFNFIKSEKAYQFETNSLAIGSYTYSATTVFNGKTLEAAGAFSIASMQLEALQTEANHNLLKQLSDKTGGAFMEAKDIGSLDELLFSQETIKPTLYESFKTRSIINLFGIFFLIMFLLSLEWFARKWFGAY